MQIDCVTVGIWTKTMFGFSGRRSVTAKESAAVGAWRTDRKRIVGGQMDVGIEILPMKSLQEEMSSRVPYCEHARLPLPSGMRGTSALSASCSTTTIRNPPDAPTTLRHSAK